MDANKSTVEIMGADDIRRAITRIAHEVAERNSGAHGLILAGMHTRGVPLARRIAVKLKELEGAEVPVIEMDITNYRDDLPDRSERMSVEAVPDSLRIDGRPVVIVDDVLYTGRTIRAALDALVDLGRANRVQLAVLIDRGHRELPIRPDYVGKNVPTSRSEAVQVSLVEIDAEDSVRIVKQVR